MPTRIKYGPLQRPWKNLAKALVGMIVVVLVGATGSYFFMGGHNSITCERGPSTGDCALRTTHFFVFTSEQTFSIEDVREVSFYGDVRENDIFLQFHSSPEIVLHGAWERDYEKIHSFFFASPSVKKLDVSIWNLRDLMDLAFGGFFLFFAFTGLWPFLRRPGSVVLTLLGDDKLRVSQRWFWIPLGLRVFPLKDVDQIEVRYSSTELFMVSDEPFPLGRLSLRIRGESSPLTRTFLGGSAVHDEAAAELASALGVPVAHPKHVVLKKERTRKQKEETNPPNLIKQRPGDFQSMRRHYRISAISWVLFLLLGGGVSIALLLRQGSEGGEFAAIGVAIPLAGFVLASLIGLASYEVRPTGFVLVIRGRKYRREDGTMSDYRIGKGDYPKRIPVVERAQLLDTRPRRVSCRVRGACSKDPESIDLDFSAEVSISENEPQLHKAIERFAGREGDVCTVAQECLEAEARGVISANEADDLRTELDWFAIRIGNAANDVLEPLGLNVSTPDIESVS